MSKTSIAAVVLAATTVVGVGTVAAAATIARPAAAPSPVAASANTAPTPAAAPGVGGGWMGGRGDGTGGGGAAAGSTARANEYDVPAAVPGATITDELAAQLRYLIAEEKLARDIYTLAASTYGDRVFANIATSEANHIGEVGLLLSRYQVEDPTLGDASGKFDDPELQALYDNLANQVSQGRTQAYQAGVTVEQTDIADLDEALAIAAPADVTAILENLKVGSQRHLVAFQRWA